MKAIVFETRK